MNRIQKAFCNGKALITCVTCGDPDLETTVRVVCAAVEAGADLIELGIPFSDPTAEGPVIQRSGLRALQGGVTTDQIFDMVRTLRRMVDVPMVFTTYANVVYSYGAERFVGTCREIGIDGLVLTDIPYEEKEEFAGICKENGVLFMSFVTPTSRDRIAKIASAAEGFLYLVEPAEDGASLEKITEDIGAAMNVIRSHTAIPCVVGFGVSTLQQAAQMATISDGVIVDVPLMKILEQYGREAAEPVGTYIKETKDAICAL